MLMYMRRMRFEDYCYTIKKLGLKDVYAQTVRARQLIINNYYSRLSGQSGWKKSSLAALTVFNDDI